MSNKIWALLICTFAFAWLATYGQHALGASVPQGTLPTSMTATPTAIAPQPTSTPAPTGGPALPCTTNPWRFTTNMTTQRRLFNTAVAANGFIYALTAIGFAAEYGDMVEHAPINADGTLGLWQRNQLLSTPRPGLAAASVNGYLYVLGGGYGNTILNSTEYAKINLDGSLGDWQPTSPMLQQRSSFSAVTANGYIYALGGYDATYATVERAKINADGSLGAWENVNSINQRYIYTHRAFFLDNYLYVVSDHYPVEQVESVERAVLNSDGTLGAWQIIGSLPSYIRGSTPLVVNDFLYLFGGHVNSKISNPVIRIPITTSGQLGAPQTLDSLHFDRLGAMVVTDNGNVYVLGGMNSRDLRTEDTVEWAQLTTLDVPHDYGVSLNKGALFTNQTAVTLTLSGKTSAREMQVSNDGGFVGATWEPCLANKTWEITRLGNYIIPRTVYVRYRDDQGTVTNALTDDIILDVTPPSGSVTILPLSNRQQRQLAQSTTAAQATRAANTVYLPIVAANQTGSPIGSEINITLQLAAQDDVSGVADMLISTAASFDGAAWQAFKSAQTWPVPTNATTTVYVKFRDNAGNVSTTVTATVAVPPQS